MKMDVSCMKQKEIESLLSRLNPCYSPSLEKIGERLVLILEDSGSAVPRSPAAHATDLGIQSIPW